MLWKTVCPYCHILQIINLRWSRILYNNLFNLINLVDTNRTNTYRMSGNIYNFILSSCSNNSLKLLLIDNTFIRFTRLNICYSLLSTPFWHATLTPANSSKVNILLLTMTFLTTLQIIFNLHQLPQTFQALIN